MEVLISLALPVEAHSVPLARHLVAVLLRDLGVTDDARHEIELALSEACANVVRHAGTDGEYQLRVRVDRGECEIVVSDAGAGFAVEAMSPAAESASGGRGLELMRSLMDSASFESAATGTAVHLHKRLSFQGQPATGGER